MELAGGSTLLTEYQMRLGSTVQDASHAQTIWNLSCRCSYLYAIRNILLRKCPVEIVRPIYMREEWRRSEDSGNNIIGIKWIFRLVRATFYEQEDCFVQRVSYTSSKTQHETTDIPRERRSQNLYVVLMWPDTYQTGTRNFFVTGCMYCIIYHYIWGYFS